jgi:hypothetical protein
MPTATDEDLGLLSQHAADQFEKQRRKFLIKIRVAKHRQSKKGEAVAETGDEPAAEQKSAKVKAQPSAKPLENLAAEPESPKPAKVLSKQNLEVKSVVRPKPDPVTICDYNYGSRRAEMIVNGALIHTTELFPEKPFMGQASPVSAKFATIGDVRVAAIYWGVISGPKGPDAVFRDFKVTVANPAPAVKKCRASTQVGSNNMECRGGETATHTL